MNKLFTIAAGLVLPVSVSGCAGVSQAVQAYGTVAVTNARAVDDTVIEGQKVALCALPLSALARHPEIVPAVRSLCLAPSDASTASLLDAIELRRQQPAK